MHVNLNMEETTKLATVLKSQHRTFCTSRTLWKGYTLSKLRHDATRFPCLTFRFNSLTPMSDQEKISHNSVNTISCRQVITIKKNINSGLVDTIPHSQDKHHRNFVEDSKES